MNSSFDTVGLATWCSCSVWMLCSCSLIIQLMMSLPPHHLFLH